MSRASRQTVLSTPQTHRIYSVEFSVDSFYIQFHAYARQNRMWILSRKSTPAKSRGRLRRLSGVGRLTVFSRFSHLFTPIGSVVATRIGNTSSSALRGHEAIFRYTVNSVSKFFLNSCTCAHAVRSRKPLCGPSRAKEKCAQCMVDPD